jgi:Rha family phage regulatory protein
MEQMNIVQLSTQDVSKALPVTTSLIVAEYFSKEHAKVLRDIRELSANLKDVSNFGEMYHLQELSYKDSYGRENPMFEMNRSFWMMLVMGYTGKKAIAIKHEFIKQFNLMEGELIVRQETRHIGIKIRHILTDSINNHVSDVGRFKFYAYGNYTKMVYKKVLGMDVKKAKKIRGLKETDKIRDFLTISELETVQNIESKIAAFIELSDTKGKDDKQIYAMVKEWIDNQEIKAYTKVNPS